VHSVQCGDSIDIKRTIHFALFLFVLITDQDLNRLGSLGASILCSASIFIRSDIGRIISWIAHNIESHTGEEAIVIEL
jgi:hypothetical protein